MYAEVRRPAAGGHPRVLHVVNSLGTGGAQMMLCKLVEAGAGGPYEHAVLTLMPGGALRGRLRRVGVQSDDLGLARGRVSPAGVLRLAGNIRGSRPPDLLMSWMYHSALALTLGQPFLGRSCPVIWNVRHSLHDLKHEKPLTRAVIRACAWLSRRPAAIIYNSHVGARQHEALGYAAAKSVVIPNGFDVGLFRPRPEARARLRAELGLAPAAIVVGMVARADPMKDQTGLIEAAAVLRAGGHDVHLVLAGPGVDSSNAALVAVAERLGLIGRVAFLGERHDIPELVAGFDVAALSSAWGEGFPNAVGEAMASGVPCVVTEIGDCARIVGATGVVVPPGDRAALAAGLAELVALGPEGRYRLGEAARARIVADYDLASIVRRYDELCTEVRLRQRGRRRKAGARPA